MPSPKAAAPEYALEHDGDTLRIALRGAWTIAASRALERAAGNLAQIRLADVTGQEAGEAQKIGAGEPQKIAIDFADVLRLDTAGAFFIDKARGRLAAGGVRADYVHLDPEQEILLREAAYAPPEPAEESEHNIFHEILIRLGQWTVALGKDIGAGVSFLGEMTAGALQVCLHPTRARPTSLIFHMESFALRAVPIIVTINFLVGAIVEQQSIFQLRRFGASTYGVDLLGVLSLRELGVLLTSIMIAGRSGSAITAEIGSMKMREEIDALQVMGMSPMDVLVLPRIMALVLSLPILTFIADMAALGGGMVTAYLYDGISATSFLVRLQDAIGLNTFLVGLIKAPFMALVIGIIACIEGFRVEGSAESLGRRVTVSVVNAIFMVIFVDGLFAIFFAGVRY